jgi:endonuclease-8
MPEGDTIHSAARRIRAVVETRVPDEILTPHPRHGMDGWPEALAGAGVRSVDAHGKHLFLRFDNGLTIHSHLRMTGSWSVRRRGEHGRRGMHRAWLLMRVGDHEIVEFDGPVLELVRDSRTRSDPQLAALGPDIIGESFDTELFLERLRAGDRSRPIGEALLDQQVLAGIGNVWKCETCFAVAVDPWRATGAVEDREARELAAFARERMAVSARRGALSRPRAVYGRAGRACPRCGARVHSRAQGENNRITYWCPGCQL